MKERLDKVLVERKLVPGREQARAMILAGNVIVDERRVDKPGTQIAPDAEIRIKGKEHPYVGRGGIKLEKALKVFDVETEGSVCLDIGASTGGFTHCLLLNGARKVCALDVGYNQLDWSLRNDGRVEVRERVNARYLKPCDFNRPFDIVTVDVIFISLAKILPVIPSLLNDGGSVICLVKPQFEVGRGKVGKGGVVKEPKYHKEAVLKVVSRAEECSLYLKDAAPSPIEGSDGNREFFLHLSPRSGILDGEMKDVIIEEAVYG